jgi:hypothetical protein
LYLTLYIKSRVEKKQAAVMKPDHGLNNKQQAHFIPVYNSCVQDRAWANSGLIAHVKAGDTVLSFQQRIIDAGFSNVMVTPLGGDRVFLSCTGEDNFAEVLQGANEFFGMLFTNFHKWSEASTRYERGAWLRVYGIPVHAWNDSFFRLTVSGIGRFLYVDECTMDKGRLDFARILIVTPELEIVNRLSDFVIDGRQYSIKIVEEWGYNIGEDAFMSKGEVDSTPEEGNQIHIGTGLDEVQGEWELDDLVTDLQNEWCQHEKKLMYHYKFQTRITMEARTLVKNFLRYRYLLF